MTPSHVPPPLPADARPPQSLLKSSPWPNEKRLARMRLIGPVFGTPESSSGRSEPTLRSRTRSVNAPRVGRRSRIRRRSLPSARLTTRPRCGHDRGDRAQAARHGQPER